MNATQFCVLSKYQRKVPWPAYWCQRTIEMIWHPDRLAMNTVEMWHMKHELACYSSLDELCKTRDWPISVFIFYDISNRLIPLEASGDHMINGMFKCLSVYSIWIFIIWRITQNHLQITKQWRLLPVCTIWWQQYWQKLQRRSTAPHDDKPCGINIFFNQCSICTSQL